MKKSGTILGFSIADLKVALEKETLGMDELCELISIATDPEQLKLLMAALIKTKLKEAAKAQQLEEEAQEIFDHAQKARARADQAEDVIQQTNDLIRRLLEKRDRKIPGSRLGR